MNDQVLSDTWKGYFYFSEISFHSTKAGSDVEEKGVEMITQNATVASQSSLNHFHACGYAEKHRIQANDCLDCPDSEASRGRSFVLRSQELHILSFIWEIQYPNLID
ncbi:hypothetical protein Tco_1039835 [Tanacetum coccineum]